VKYRSRITRSEVITMWWEYIVVPALLVVGGYGFALMVGVNTRWLTRKTDRNAESMYANYASPRRHLFPRWHSGR
jgi:hypothetical protein